LDTLLPKDLAELAQRVITENKKAGRKIATAESCTGGLISAALTEIAGSSAVFLAAYISYSNGSKARMLNVDPAAIIEHGAVSREVAGQMAEGALTHSGADIAVSVSGIAGPGGGTEDKPVGTITFGVAKDGELETLRAQFGENRTRAEIRNGAAAYALELLLP